MRIERLSTTWLIGLMIGLYQLTAFAQEPKPQLEGLDQAKSEVRQLIETAINAGDLPGAVVGFWSEGRWLIQEVYGNRAMLPSVEPMSLDTIFDMASITKPVSTAASIMILVDRGQVDIDAPVARYLPAFTGDGRDEVLVKHLLRHTAGLIPDNAIEDYKAGQQKAWENLFGSKIKTPPGSKFVYSDVCFLLLGKIVEAMSGQSLNDFAKQNIFEPLAMKDSGYLPSVENRPRIAPTEARDGEMLRGIVHDPRAALLGGVAGHAGLFSTLEDIGRFAQMMLNEGELEGRRILSKDIVRIFTTPHVVEVRPDFGPLSRTNGFDHRSTYSYNNGGALSQAAFGHGGFTGTVLWIDPDKQCFFVFLSNRLHPDGVGNVNKLAGAVVKKIAEKCLPIEPSADSLPGIRVGIDVLEQTRFRALSGKRIGLVTNHTGRNAIGKSTAQVLKDAKDVQLVALFSPEHGYQGLLDQSRIGDSKDESIQLPVFSLYGATRRPTAEQLAQVDCIVYDIQDIGCRFYTYISTMKECMLAANEHGKGFVVLDRPNPIGGRQVLGPMVDPGKESFVACHPLPVQHGMTVGELARLFVQDLGLKLDLTVIPVRNWTRDTAYESTGLEWVDPSPNMRSITAARLYPGIGLLETTNISVGRGTERPFEWIGAPWINSRQLAHWLNKQSLPGIRVVPRSATPSASKYANEKCGGVQFIITDLEAFNSLRLGLTLATGLRELYPEDWKAKSAETLLVNEKVLQSVLDGTAVNAIEQLFSDDLQTFESRRKRALIYE